MGALCLSKSVNTVQMNNVKALNLKLHFKLLSTQNCFGYCFFTWELMQKNMCAKFKTKSLPSHLSTEGGGKFVSVYFIKVTVGNFYKKKLPLVIVLELSLYPDSSA